MRRRQTKARPDSGSPPPGEPEYLVVGYLRRPYGLRGEMIMEIITDFPERLKPGATVYVGSQHLPVTITAARSHSDGLVLKLAGIDSPEAASAHRKEQVSVRAANLPTLPEGMFYHHELLGFDVVGDNGQFIGKLTQILQTGANDVYVISSPEGGETLVPAIASVVEKIDRPARRIQIRELPGLMDTIRRRPGAR